MPYINEPRWHAYQLPCKMQCSVLCLPVQATICHVISDSGEALPAVFLLLSPASCSDRQSLAAQLMRDHTALAHIPSQVTIFGLVSVSQCVRRRSGWHSVSMC
jgi:hypothetical protein